MLEGIELGKLTDLGGIFIICLLLLKVIYNDLKHIQEKLNDLEGHAKDSKEILKEQTTVLERIAAGVLRHK